jgi:ABC-type nitrate/sulfonate/bicarbonate transport system substrate-binding protein
MLVLYSVLVGCGLLPSTSTPIPAAPATADRPRSGTLRFGKGSAWTMRNVPLLMAFDALKAEGYTVESTDFANSDLARAAMANGDIDVMELIISNAAMLVSKGVDMRSIVGDTNMSFYLVLKQAIATCADLNGRSLGFNNRQSTGYAMYAKYMKENCPNATPQVVLIPNSASRLAALRAGQIDGADLELEEWQELQHQAPGKFKVYIDFVKALPNMQVFTFGARRKWLQQNQEMVKDFIRELVLAQRQVLASPQLLADEGVKRLELDRAAAEEAAEVYDRIDRRGQQCDGCPEGRWSRAARRQRARCGRSLIPECCSG